MLKNDVYKRLKSLVAGPKRRRAKIGGYFREVRVKTGYSLNSPRKSPFIERPEIFFHDSPDEWAARAVVKAILPGSLARLRFITLIGLFFPGNLLL